MLILLAVLGIILCFLHDPGTGDLRTFESWVRILQAHGGPFAGYAVIRDYPPLGPLLLWTAAHVGSWFGASEFMSLKVLIAGAEAISVLIALLWLRSSLTALILYLIIVPFGVMLGYIDALFLPFLLLTLIALERDELWLAALAMTVTVFIKWQPAILGPFVLVYILSRQRGLTHGSINLLPATAFAAAVVAAFGLTPILTAFFNVTRDPDFSGYALNLSWIITFFVEHARVLGQHLLADGAITYIEPIPPILFDTFRAVFFAAYGACLLLFVHRRRNFDDLLLFLLVGYLTYFTLNTGVHENHLFSGAVLGLLCWRRGLIDSLGFLLLAMVATLNAPLFYGIAGQGLGFSHVTGVDGSLVISLLEVGLYVSFWHALLIRLRQRQPSLPLFAAFESDAFR